MDNRRSRAVGRARVARFALRRLRALCRKTLILGTTVFPEQPTPQTAVFLPGLDARARERLTYPTRGVKRGLDSDFEPEKGIRELILGALPERRARDAGYRWLRRRRAPPLSPLSVHGCRSPSRRAPLTDVLFSP